MNVLSLFSGIGGIELGLERAGMDTVGQVEMDPFCNTVLSKHWPDVPKHSDVRTAVDWWKNERRPEVDVICGGFPCQPFSNASAGRQHVAQNGWPWMRDVIDGIRPRYVLGENVSALLRKPEFGIILQDLADLGYVAEWSVVSACAFGATHRRRRVYLVAHTDCDGEPVLQVDAEAPRDCTLPTIGSAPIPRDMGVDDGLPRRMDRLRLRALGNSVVPQISHHIGKMILQHGTNQQLTEGAA